MINGGTLTLKNNSDIIWSILFLILLRMFKIDDQIIVVLAIVFILFISIKAKRFFIPNLSGIRFYCIVLVITFFYGLVQYEVRDIMKSLYYMGGSLVLIYLAFVIQSKYENKSIIKTLYLGGLVIVFQSIVMFVTNFSKMYNLDSIRQLEGDFVYEVSAITIVFLIEKIFYKKIIFGRFLDYILLTLYIIKIAISLSRSGIGQLVIEVIVAIVCIAIFDTRKIKTGTVIALSVMAVIFMVVFTLLPNDSINAFNEKLGNTSEEMNYNQEFNSAGDAMQNWRAYEIHEAKNQWKGSGAFDEIFGEGMGSSLRAKYIPFNWTGGMIEGNRIPILHNGFYTMLIIGGLMGVLSMLVLMLSPILLLIKNRNNEKIKMYLIAAVSTSVAMLFCTYVVNGLITRSLFFNWCMIYGCAYGMASKYGNSTENEIENE